MPSFRARGFSIHYGLHGDGPRTPLLLVMGMGGTCQGWLTVTVPDLIRAPMARLLKRSAPRLKVLGHSEIPDTHSIRIASVIGAAA